MVVEEEHHICPRHNHGLAGEMMELLRAVMVAGEEVVDTETIQHQHQLLLDDNHLVVWGYLVDLD